MAKYDPEWDRVVRQLEVHFWRDHKTQFLELEEENKRLKKLVNDLQHEIELKVLQSLETHELEEK